MSRATVGIIGMGALGLPVAANIAKARPIIGYDPLVPSGEIREGVRAVASIGDLATTVQTILLCLPSPAISIDVVSTIATFPHSTASLIIELSTVGIDAAHTCAEIAQQAEIGYIDAPVSGLRAKAWNGDVTVMAAGPPEHMLRARPIFDLFASQSFNLGPRAGLGQVMKLANAIVNATSFVITSEAIAFGTRLGLDLEQMVEVLNASTGRTSASVEKFPQNVIPESSPPGAHGEIIQKDVTLFVEAATAAATPTRISEATADMWTEYVRRHPESESVGMYRYLKGFGEPATESGLSQIARGKDDR